MKRKAIVTSLLFALSFSPMLEINNNYFLSPTIVSAEQTTQDIGVKNKSDKKDTNEKEEKVIVDFSTGNYKLINDKTETLNEEDIQAITKELSSIYEKGAKHNDLKTFKMFTFIYDSPSKSIPEASAEILSNNKLSENEEPVIFIYNKANKEYKYIIDSSLQNYISLAYLEDVTNKTIVGKGLSKETLGELLIRTNSSIEMALIGDFNNLNKTEENKINKKHFEIRDIVKNDKNDTQTTEKNNSAKTTTTNTNEDNQGLYTGVALFLALVSLFVVFYKRKKKNHH